MSLKGWWEERKRLQAEREARRYGAETESDEGLWLEPEEELSAESEFEEPDGAEESEEFDAGTEAGEEPEEQTALEEPEDEAAVDADIPEDELSDLYLDDSFEEASEAVHEIDEESASLTPPGMDVPGPRRSRLEEERRNKRNRELKRGAAAAAIAAVVGIVGLVSILSRDEAPEPPDNVAARGPDGKDTITTTLVFGTKERAHEPVATWMALLSVDVEKDRGAIVYIPAHTAAEVPGRGLHPIGDALDSGGVPLLLLSVETLLGTKIDRYLEISDSDAKVLFGEMGELTVDVPGEVRIPAGPGQARLLFGQGPQRLSPELLVELLYIRGLDGDDVDLGGRHLAFWSSLFEAYSFDADGLAEAVRTADDALGESDVPVGDHAEMLEELAGLDPADRTISLLPVRKVSVGNSELYEADRAEIEDFIEEAIGAREGGQREVRVQILNGNGSPGIGQDVAQRLGGERFRVILSGNARRLNYRETLVITYDSSSRGIDLAERTRDLIGVGEVQVAAQSQGIVDLTIVVGRDFLKTL